MEVLMEQGVASVTIDRLAGLLGVTRGSFYYHFEDRADLLKAMLDYWEGSYTSRIREDVASLRLPPSEALLVLIRTIRNRDAAKYDVAFRAWALHDPIARERLKKIDKFRLDFIRDLFSDLGFERLDAEMRARLYLYYEMTEPSMFAPQTPDLQEKLIEARHKLLTGT